MVVGGDSSPCGGVSGADSAELTLKVRSQATVKVHCRGKRYFITAKTTADPYCSWRHGTNETTNGLLRRYFPKRTDFQLVSQETVNEVVIRINSTPRKVLGYQTPSEVFTAHIMRRVFGLTLEFR
jgi:IS30 family transposase